MRLAPLLRFWYKRALGEGGCDSLIRGAYSLREFLVKNDVCGLTQPSVQAHLTDGCPHLSTFDVVYNRIDGPTFKPDKEVVSAVSEPHNAFHRGDKLSRLQRS